MTCFPQMIMSYNSVCLCLGILSSSIYNVYTLVVALKTLLWGYLYPILACLI